MRYYRTLLTLFFLNVLAIFFLLYFANISRQIENQNYKLTKEVNYFENQININEIEYSLYNSYDYLEKLHKIYFNNFKNNNSIKRISYYDFQNNNLQNLYNVGIK
jgi:hypothetical protein